MMALKIERIYVMDIPKDLNTIETTETSSVTFFENF